MQPLLVERSPAAAARAYFLSVRESGVPHPRMLAATGANDHYVRNIHRAFFFDDAALDVLPRIRPRVALDDRSMFDHHGILLGVDREHTPALTSIATGDDFHLVALADTDGVPLGSFMSQCHCLPNLRSQRNNLCKLLVAQLSCHRAKHARSHGFARF